MTAEGCRQWRERLGVLVLGQLAEQERVATEAHIEACEECRAELALLSPLGSLLPLADPDHVMAPAPAPPAGLGERIGRRISSERSEQSRRRRLRFGFALSGAAVAAAAVAAALIVTASPAGGGGGTEQVAFRHLPPGVHIGATLRPHDWGTQVSMRVSGIRSGTLCRVYLRNGAGAQPVGSFRYRYANENTEEVLSGALDISAVRAVEVRAGPRTFVQPVPGGVGA